MLAEKTPITDIAPEIMADMVIAECVHIIMPCVGHVWMLYIRVTSDGPVSVRLSVTSRCSTKTAKRRIS